MPKMKRARMKRGAFPERRVTDESIRERIARCQSLVNDCALLLLGVSLEQKRMLMELPAAIRGEEHARRPDQGETLH